MKILYRAIGIVRENRRRLRYIRHVTVCKQVVRYTVEALFEFGSGMDWGGLLYDLTVS